MAGWENLLTPSTETIRGISDRTGMNLPDLPYGGILSLLTGGPIGLATHYAANNVIPAMAHAVNPNVGALMDQGSSTNEYLLDKVFGKVPEPENVPWADIMGVEPQDWWGANNPDNIDIGGGFNPAEYEMPTIDLERMLGIQNDVPTFSLSNPAVNLSNIGMDFEQMPDFNQFDFQDSMPSFDYTDFDFRKGGKV